MIRYHAARGHLTDTCLFTRSRRDISPDVLLVSLHARRRQWTDETDFTGFAAALSSWDAPSGRVSLLKGSSFDSSELTGTCSRHSECSVPSHTVQRTSHSVVLALKTGALQSTCLGVCSANLKLLCRFVAPMVYTPAVWLIRCMRAAILSAWPPYAHEVCRGSSMPDYFSPGTLWTFDLFVGLSVEFFSACMQPPFQARKSFIYLPTNGA